VIFVAVAPTANLRLVLHLMAVLAMHRRGGAGVVLGLALAVTVVRRQCRGRASQHEHSYGKQNKEADDQTSRECRLPDHEFADRVQIPTSTRK
jgi:hypothetical protein